MLSPGATTATEVVLQSVLIVSESARVFACAHGEFPVPLLTCNLCHRHQRRAGNQMRPTCLVKSRHDSYCRQQRRRCCESEEDTRYTLKGYQMKTPQLISPPCPLTQQVKEQRRICVESALLCWPIKLYPIGYSYLDWEPGEMRVLRIYAVHAILQFMQSVKGNATC